MTIQKGDPNVWPIAAAVAALGLGAILAAPRILHSAANAKPRSWRSTSAG